MFKHFNWKSGNMCMKTLIRVLVLKYPHWQSLLNNKSICNSTIMQFTYYTCIIYNIYVQMYFGTYLSRWMTRQWKWVTLSSPLSFYLQDVQLFINQSFTQFFILPLWCLCCQARLHSPPVSVSSRRLCTRWRPRDNPLQHLIANVRMQSSNPFS